ncbi:MAG TPA: hypothetical protein VFC00_18710 [Micromonosporaceae bacterium]|nr:hypothetical protein [Micromonosporaceae bacterium]
MSSMQIAIIVIVVVVVLFLAVGVVFLSRRRALRARFGPEYDRVVSEQDGRGAGERELRERERRHTELDLRPLDPSSRERYAGAWEEIQVRFIDAPDQAVGKADVLVTELIAERGYPTGGFDQQVADLSVEHARLLGHYREAHDIHQANERGEAPTEQLRQALVHYRTLFADLLGTEPVRPSSNGSAADATPDRERQPNAPIH